MMAGIFGIPGLGMLFFWGLLILLAVLLIKRVPGSSEPLMAAAVITVTC